MGFKAAPMLGPRYGMFGPELGPLYATINAIIRDRSFQIYESRDLMGVNIYTLVVNGDDGVKYSFREPKEKFPSDELVTELMLRWG